MRLFILMCILSGVALNGNGQKKILGSWFEEVDQLQWIIHYSKEYKEDSLKLDRVRADNMILLVGDSISLFTSYNMLLYDSLLIYMRDHKTGLSEEEQLKYSIQNMPSGRFMYKVTKNYPKDKVRYQNIFMSESYEVHEQLHGLKWEINSEAETRLMGYPVHRATTRYGGRTWQAWFSPDIAINDGPLIFHGLPGLIVKLQDARKHYTFTLNSIEKVEPSRALKFLNTDDGMPPPVKTDLAGYIKAYYTFINSFIIHAEEAQLPTETQLRASETMRQRNNPMFLSGD